MNSFSKSLVVTLFGIATAVATAFLNVTIINAAEFDVFSLFLFFIVPVGAIIVGMLATSGFYIGASILHKRADLMMFLLMMIVAAITMFLMYYIQYAMIEFEGIKLSSVMTFKEYMELNLTEMSYSIGRRGRSGVDTGAVGSFGYIIAGVQFLGILAGAFFVYAMLGGKAGCEICGNYFKSKTKRTINLQGEEEIRQFYDDLGGKAVESPEFAEVISKANQASESVESPLFMLENELLECSGCGSQALKMNAKAYNGADWVDVPQLNAQLNPVGDNKIDHLFS